MVGFLFLQQEDLHPDLLADFQRRQVTRRVIRAGAVVPDSFEDDWDIWDKKAVLAALRKSLQGGGAVIAAFHEGRVVGFASIQGNLLGSCRQYLELDYIHVSRDFRGQGIGQKLFQGICQAARMLGAQKLYIGAHPAVETQAFYGKVGCTGAQEVIQEIYQREPRDVQLEYQL